MSYAAEVLADSPLGYWRMGEPSPPTMVDSSGHGRDGTYISSPALGVTGLLAGDSDTAAGFNYIGGSSPYCTVADDDSLDGLSTFTIEMLINPATVSGFQQIASRDDQAGGGRSWQFRLNSNKLEFVKIPNGTATATSATSLVTGTTYHVVATYDGTTIRLYVNGALDGTKATTGTLGTVDCLLRIAARRGSTATTEWFSGVIDEVAVYATALSSTRVAAHYTAATTIGTGATGTASLSLFASGGAAARSGGTGSLSLSGSGGAPSAAAAGSASLTFSATGGTVAPEPAAGTASLSLSASGGIRAATAGTASLDLIGTGTALAVLAAAGTGSLSLSASGSAVMSSGGAGFLALSAVGEAIALYLTDTTNGFRGRTRYGYGTVTMTRPTAPLPPGRTFGQRVDKAIAYPAPDMVDGRPT